MGLTNARTLRAKTCESVTSLASLSWHARQRVVAATEVSGGPTNVEVDEGSDDVVVDEDV